MFFNPLDKFHKSRIGAVSIGEKITFRVKGDFDSVVFMLRKDYSEENQHYDMQKTSEGFSLSLAFNDIGLYWYRFKVNGEFFIGLGEDYTGTISDNPTDFQLTVFSDKYCVPDWVKGGIIYQIFPDRFNFSGEFKPAFNERIIHNNKSDTPIFLPDENGIVKNNDFFGGDIKGIIQKLDYLKELGVTIIYLNPIFKAYSNHRYDTGNYMEIDSLLGTVEDFRELVDRANEMGIKIILDGVFNHTGDDSIYFNKYGNYDIIGAYQSKYSKYYDWFKFIDYPEDYESWWGIKTLPATNKNSQEFIDYITGKNGVLDYYTSMGIGGWRLDVVDELPAHFVEKIRDRVKKVNPQAFIIGEVWEDASNKVAYGVRRRYFQGGELDSVMNYPLKDAILAFVKYGDSGNLSRVIKEQIDHYPDFVLNSLMNILSTHDTFRLLSAVADVDVSGMDKSEMENIMLSGEQLLTAKFRLKCASLLEYTLYGVPSLYYGDEIGMQGYKDPLNRRFFAWENIDEEIRNWYVFLGKLRSEFSLFESGCVEEIFSDNGVYIFKRYDENSEILVCINAGQKQYGFSFESKLKNLIDGCEYNGEYQLKPLSYAVFINEKDSK